MSWLLFLMSKLRKYKFNMPDLQNLVITRNGSVNANVPRYNIVFDVTNSQNGSLIRNFNTTFPTILQQIDTEEDREEFIMNLIQWLIKKKLNNNTL